MRLTDDDGQHGEEDRQGRQQDPAPLLLPPLGVGLFRVWKEELVRYVC
jgi:hypothetical protein